MKRLVLLTLALLLSSASFAQDKPASSEEIQIRQLERAWNQAEANQQITEVANLVDDTLVYTDYDGSIMNKSEYLKWVAAPEQKADHLFDEGMTVHVYGNAAVVNGIYRESGTNKGKKYVIRSRYTDTWIRYGSIWRCVASHSTLIPAK
ncbi:MAG TPA: nuclear transport factor 2 family protein [Candidatus Acidoferrum sp.]|nr:nuclear transport factor 2 family protein [Candidatus Acidoferrum sp.]